jgi:ethanolamine permease
VIGLIYFAVVGRHKLVLSPEEEFALSQGKYGANLEREGYGAMSATEIAAQDTKTPSA